MQPLATSQIVDLILMWSVVICYFTGMILMSRQKHHVDPAKFSDPSNVRRFTRNVYLPPLDLLTDKGRWWRKLIYTLLGVASVAFLILVLKAL